MTRGKRIYVLDTNVLMHDPTALFRFEEHDVFLPMTVLEELDAAKKGTSETSRNARQVSRFINELIENATARTHRGRPGAASMPQGLQLDRKRAGRTSLLPDAKRRHERRPSRAKRALPDNLILASSSRCASRSPKEPVVLVSKDINLRIKATIFGITAEDYENDRALDDFSLLYAGAQRIAEGFLGSASGSCARGPSADTRSTK